MTNNDEPTVMTVEMFPLDYRAKMIAAYPVIAGLSADEVYLSGSGELDKAFSRVLAAKNLRTTHELFLGWPVTS